MEVYDANLKENEFLEETPVVVEEKIGDTIRKYEKGKYLGKGGFALCYELKSKDTNKIYAAKVFDKVTLSNAKSKKKLINEIKLHKKLHHGNIVNFEHFFEDNDNVYILLELCSNQTLNELLKRRKRLSEIEVQCYLIQIIKALKYIHAHKIIHRDIKLGNCFLTNKLELKLGDFGLAAKLEYEGERRRTICGTPNYMAPEILEKKNGHSFEVDVWSLGVLAYSLLFGKTPFETNDVKATYKKIKMNDYSFPEKIHVHTNAKKLISVILNLDPNKRPTLDQILEHEFFRMFSSIPVVMPLSSMACPPSKKFIGQYIKTESRLHARQSSVKTIKYSGGILNNLRSTDDVLGKSEKKYYTVEELKSYGKEFVSKLLKIQVDNNSDLTNTDCKNSIEKIKRLLENNKDLGLRSIYDSKIEARLFERESFHSRKMNQIDEFNNLENHDSKLNDSLLNKLENLNIQISQDKFNDILSILNPDFEFSPEIEINFEHRISKYFDYTNKFGIVYFFNNSHLGICFNDNSNLLFFPTNNLTGVEKNSKYSYIEKDFKNMINLNDNYFEKFINDKNGDKEVIKKFEIFKNILKKYNDHIIYDKSRKTKAITDKFINIDDIKFVYVKKFLNTQHAIMFRLSNKLTQFCFFDKTELILSTDSDELWYLWGNGEEIRDRIENIMCSLNSEIIKRIKYAKNLLIYYVKNYKNRKL